MSDKELGFKIKVLGTDEEVSKLGKVESQIKALALQRAALNKALKDGNITQEEYGQQLADINLKTQSLRGSKRELERSIEVENELLSQQGGSYNQLSSELNNLRQQYRNMSEEERNSAEGTELLQKIDGLDQELKDIDASMGQYQRNVGNYGSAFEAVGGQLTNMSPILGQAQQQFTQINNVLVVVKDSLFGQQAAQDAANVATQGGIASQKGLAITTSASNTAINAQTKALRLLRIALLATGLGAFVVLIGTLITALTSTQRGMDAVNSVLRPLSAYFQRLFGLIQDFGLGVFDRLKKAIDNPKQAAIDFGIAVRDNILNRIKAVPQFFRAAFNLATNLFGAFAFGVKKLLADVPIIGNGIDAEKAEADYKKATEGIKKESKALADATIQATLGIEEGTERMVKFAEQSRDFWKESYELGSRLHELNVQIEKDENAILVSRERLNTLYQEQRLLAQDQNATDNERITALNKAQAAQEELLRLEQELLDKKIERKELENSQNDTSREDEMELQKLFAERERAQAQAARRLSTLVSLRSGLVKKQRAAEAKEIEANNKKILEQANQLVEDELQVIQAGIAKKSKLYESLEQLRVLEIKERLANEVISEEQAQQEILLLRKATIDRKLKDAKQESDEIRSMQAELHEELAELMEAEQTDENLLRQKAIQEQLDSLEVRNNEVLAMAKQLKIDLVEIAKSEEEGSFISELFGVKEEQAQAIRSQLNNLAQSLYNGFFQLRQQELQKSLNKELSMIEGHQNKAVGAAETRFKEEKRLLQSLLREGEISQEQYNERLANLEQNLSGEKERINDKYAQKEEELRRQSFEREQDLAISRARMDAALAIIKAFATMDPISATIYAAAIGVSTGVQISRIQAQEFALGGMINGASHAQGGVHIEAEGGEAIINKRTMASADFLNLSGTPFQIASQLNAYKGFGKPFGMGGMTAPIPSPPPSNSRFLGITAAQMDRIAGELADKVILGVNDKRVILVKGDQDDFNEEVSFVKRVQKW